MPAIENMKIASASASDGLVLERPERSLISSTIWPRWRMARMQAKPPSVITM